MCDENDAKLLECDYDEVKNNYCEHYEDVGVSCGKPQIIMAYYMHCVSIHIRLISISPTLL